MTPNDDDPPADATLLIRRTPTADVAQRDAVGHFLVWEGSPTQSAGHVEIAGAPVTMGRDVSQTVVIGDTGVSRRHARVSLIFGEAVLEDLGSTNGTFVDGVRIATPTVLREGNVVLVGGRVMTYTRRSRSEMARAEELARDLASANAYVNALLPARLTDGPVRTDWCFVPSTQLGGDAFGYYWLDPHTFVFYLLDVCGHGATAAMHSVTILNVLRQRALPQVDFTNPADVLASLNNRFQMDRHNEMYFTIWYGVYRPTDRSLTYSAGGHHAAYLRERGAATLVPLGTSALMIGAIPDVTYSVAQTTLPAGRSLFVFSDGVFEITTRDQRQWGLADFLPLLARSAGAPGSEAEALHQAVLETSRPGPLDDDFSLMVVDFL